MPFIFVVMLYVAVAHHPPRSDRQNSQHFRPRAIPRKLRSAALLLSIRHTTSIAIGESESFLVRRFAPRILLDRSHARRPFFAMAAQSLCVDAVPVLAWWVISSPSLRTCLESLPSEIECSKQR
jgi:hypothetical protein